MTQGNFYNELIEYDIHRIIKIKCNVPDIVPSIFKVDQINGDPDLSFYICPEHKSQIPSTTHLSYRIAMLNLLGHTKVYYRINTLKSIIHRTLYDVPSPELFYFITNTLMPLKLLQKNYSFVHSACLSRDGEGLLLVAPPDTGKTYTALALNRVGFSYLSDDMTIVKKNIAYCYPTHLTITPVHIKTFKLSTSYIERLNLKVRRAMNKIPIFTSCLDGMRMVPERIVKGIRMQTKIKNIFFLDRGSEKIEELDCEVGFKKLKATVWEFKIFESRHILNYLFKNPCEEINLERLLEERNKIYADLAQNVRIFNVTSKKRAYYKLILDHINKI
jgi:hypothetical protein